MSLPRVVPNDVPSGTARFLRDVRQILTAAVDGIRWRDNIGPVHRFTWNTANAPVRVAVDEEAPVAVLCLSAQPSSPADNRVWSGCAVQWSRSRGDLLIHAIDALDASTDYQVDLGLLRG